MAKGGASTATMANGGASPNVSDCEDHGTYIAISTSVLGFLTMFFCIGATIILKRESKKAKLRSEEMCNVTWAIRKTILIGTGLALPILLFSRRLGEGIDGLDHIKWLQADKFKSSWMYVNRDHADSNRDQPLSYQHA